MFTLDIVIDQLVVNAAQLNFCLLHTELIWVTLFMDYIRHGIVAQVCWTGSLLLLTCGYVGVGRSSLLTHFAFFAFSDLELFLYWETRKLQFLLVLK